MNTDLAHATFENTRRCKQCGELNPASARFCGSCGAAIELQSDTTLLQAGVAVTTPLPPPVTDRLPVGEIVTSSTDTDLYIITSNNETGSPRTYEAESVATGARMWLHEAIDPASLAGLTQWVGHGVSTPYVAELEPAYSTVLFGTERLFVPEFLPHSEPTLPKNANEWLEVARELARGLVALHDEAGVAFDLTPDTFASHYTIAQGIARWRYLRDLIPVESRPEAPYNDVGALVSALQQPLSTVPGLKHEIDAVVAGTRRITSSLLSQLLGEPALKPMATHQNLKRWHVELGCATDKGVVREQNEDNFGTATRGDAARPTLLLLVADGMGGEEAGEIASEIAVTSLKESFATFQPGSGAQINAWIQQAIDRANTVVTTEALNRGNQMGATLVLALIHDGVAYFGNVGDSRIYRWNSHRDHGQLVRQTRDHSLVQRLVDLGQITDEERYTHPDRNLVLRSLGDRRNCKSDQNQPVAIRSGDWIILCSDGLWEMVRDDRMREILSKSHSAQMACDQLISEANTNGGEDNITAVVARFG